MITFLDEKDIEYGAQVELKVTNGINGEKSISGTIHSNDDVLNNIDKGWRLRFKNEYYVIIYSLPVDLGNVIEVEFDAVHQFFYDFKKSIVHQELNGSNTFAAYIRFIFQDSGYEYRIEGQVNAIEKQSFGFKNRLALFNDIIKSTGSEFQVNGKVVRIMPKVGTDLSTIVKKNFNLNELKIEKNINDFVTYKKGYGAWFDEEDHSKGRLEVEYVGVLMTIYGKIEGEPIIDERYTNAENLKKKLKDEVENSYSISVSMDFEDLTKAGYQYEQPVAGDYIMAINDDLKFREKIRIVSFESHYDVAGNLINHKVTCNDIGAVKKREADYAHMSKTIESQQEIQNKALEIANLALVAANGKNKNYYGTEMPVDKSKGTLIVGDTLFLTIGDRVKRYYWNGSGWIVDPFDEDINYVKNQLTEVFNQFDAERTETEQAINEALDSAKEEAKKLDEERQTIIEGQFEVVNKANEKLEQSIATAEQNAQDALTKARASEDLAKTAKEVSKNALANIGTVEAELGEVKTQASASVSKAQEALDAAGTLSTKVQSYEETVDGYKSEVANYSRTNETLTAKVKSYEETVDGYTQSLTRVEGKIDGGVGGRNLIIGSETREWYPYQGSNLTYTHGIQVPEWYATDAIKVTGTTGSHTLFATLSTGRPSATDPDAYVKQGDPYTYSIYFKNDGANDITVNSNGNVGGDVVKSGELKRVVLSDYARVTGYKSFNQFTVSTTVGSTVNFTYWHPQIEKGLIVSDWKLALEEQVRNTEFKSYQNEVKSTTDEHTRRLTALDGDGGRISKVEQTATQIQRSLSDYARTAYVDTKITEKAGEITTNLTKLIPTDNQIKTKIDESILADKSIKDTRNYNQTPRWYRTTYPLQTVKEFKSGAIIGIGQIGYTVLETTVPWYDTTGGRITQVATSKDGIVYKRKGSADDNSWLAWEADVTRTEFQTVKETTSLYERTIGTTETGIKSNIAKITMTDSLFQTEVGKYSEKPRNLLYDPINLSKYNRIGSHNLITLNNATGKLLRVTVTSVSSTTDTYNGVEFPLSTDSLSKGDYSFRIAVWVDTIPERGFTIRIFDKRASGSSWYFKIHKPTTTGYQTFTGNFTLPNNVSNFDPMCFQVYLRGNGQIAIGHGVLVNSSVVPSEIYDSGDNFLTSQVTQLSNSWAMTLKSGNDVKTAINATTDGIRLKGNLITLDGLVNMTSSFVVPEGNIGNLSASKITSGTIDSARIDAKAIVTNGLQANVIKSTYILADNALFDKLFTNDLATQKLATKQAWIKSGMIGDAQIGTAQIGQIDASNGKIVNLDASSITSGSMTANRIRGGVLYSTNGATSFDLNTGQLSFLQQGVGITNQFSGRPLQYLTFNSGRIHGSEGTYTALMSNSGNIMNMDENSAGIQIWNSFAKKTAVNLYGKNITFMRDAADANSIDINTVTKTVTNIEKLYALDIDVVRINGLRITPFTLSGNAGIALLYGDAGLWIGGHGDFAFKSGSGWVGKGSIIN